MTFNQAGSVTRGLPGRAAKPVSDQGPLDPRLLDQRPLIQRRPCGAWALVALGIVFSLLPAAATSTHKSAGAPQRNHANAPSAPQHFSIRAVSGPSWLNHLQMPLQQTSMGKTGTWGPAAYPVQNSVRHDLQLPSDVFGKTMVLRGADFYRLDCQSCHRVDGGGSPPEVNSLINPVRATSAALVMERMAKSGAPVEPAAARLLAAQAEASLLQRINHGGEKMPPFPDLNKLEVQALVAYLKQLTGVPGAENHQMRVAEPVARVGEHVVKGTCHICHSATGPVPTPQELLDGAVPPLGNFTRSKTLIDFVTKVTEGAPIAMGSIAQQYRGRMPAFYYLHNDEAAAAYVYLSLYPPANVTSAESHPGPRRSGIRHDRGSLANKSAATVSGRTLDGQN